MEAPAVIVYAVGLCAASACALNESSKDDIERAVNREHMTGLDHRWTISEENFASGLPNPCPCDKEPEVRKHWLLSC